MSSSLFRAHRVGWRQRCISWLSSAPTPVLSPLGGMVTKYFHLTALYPTLLVPSPLGGMASDRQKNSLVHLLSRSKPTAWDGDPIFAIINALLCGSLFQAHCVGW